MHIKNKFLRLIVSIFTALLLYFSLILVLVKGDIDEVVEGMILFAIFGLFIVLPALIFVVFTVYYLLTKKSERPKRTRFFKFMIWYLVIMALLYFAAIHTDLFG
jgi:hypothetical protein